MKQRITIIAASAIALLAMACAGTDRTVRVPTPSPLAPTPAPAALVFPQDEGPHDNRLEWWYYSGHLQDEEGDEYGFHFVVFQSLDLSDPDDAAPGYAAQFGLTDVRANDHTEDARFSSGEQPGSGSGLNGLHVAEWSLSANPYRHRFDAGTGGVRLSLSMTPTKPPALHNDIGWLAGPATGWTYYYSRPRMAAEGTLELGDRVFTVTGDAWMDHQWGEFFVLGHPGGWQWFGIQLDDGSDLMVTETRNVDGEIDALYGSLIGPDGLVRSFRPGSAELDLVTEGSWTSPHTGAEYPNGWFVNLPADGLILAIRPVVSDQEIISTRPESAIYWEGKVAVTGTRNGIPVTGKGFVELTGYVAPPPLPWR
ncbi:MAG: lipocalin-like domain-containing protein [Dehalococcoidia bacterium]|jgi:predicted secreted hydrolase|nr:lipocalin-like domain-containing protein [Dehalococcoidia bacterium]